MNEALEPISEVTNKRRIFSCQSLKTIALVSSGLSCVADTEVFDINKVLNFFEMMQSEHSVMW